MAHHVIGSLYRTGASLGSEVIASAEFRASGGMYRIDLQYDAKVIIYRLRLGVVWQRYADGVWRVDDRYRCTIAPVGIAWGARLLGLPVDLASEAIVAMRARLVWEADHEARDAILDAEAALATARAGRTKILRLAGIVREEAGLTAEA